MAVADGQVCVIIDSSKSLQKQQAANRRIDILASCVSCAPSVPAASTCLHCAGRSTGEITLLACGEGRVRLAWPNWALHDADCKRWHYCQTGCQHALSGLFSQVIKLSVYMRLELTHLLSPTPWWYAAGCDSASRHRLHRAGVQSWGPQDPPAGCPTDLQLLRPAGVQGAKIYSCTGMLGPGFWRLPTFVVQLCQT